MRGISLSVVAWCSLACGGIFAEEKTFDMEDMPERFKELQAREAEVPELEPIEGVVLDEATDLVLESGRSDLVVIQYSDWRCSHCLTALPEVREAARSAGAEMRFRNFPLSAPCNPLVDRREPERCDLARASICAHRTQTFDAFALEMLEGASELGPYSREPAFTDCMGETEVASLVRAQAESGVELGIRGTPTFFVLRDGTWGEGGTDVVLAVLAEERR